MLASYLQVFAALSHWDGASNAPTLWPRDPFADGHEDLAPVTTLTSHISKDVHYFIHPDPPVQEPYGPQSRAPADLPDDYLFLDNGRQQYVPVGNAVSPLLSVQIASALATVLVGMRPAQTPDRGSHSLVEQVLRFAVPIVLRLTDRPRRPPSDLAGSCRC